MLDQLGLNIVDARITPTGDGFSLDLYHVLEEDGAPIADSERIGEIERALWRALQHPDEAPVTVTRRVPRQARMFRTATQIAVTVDERNRRSVLELIAGDRPGLLCDVGKVLMEERVDLLAAKIMTVGERAEDVFYLASLSGAPLDEAAADAAAAAAVRHARSPRRRVNQRLELLAAYPFERLARLKAGITPPAALPHIAMSIGEPKHAPPAFVIEALRRESRQARQLPGDRGPAGNARRLRRLARTPLQGARATPDSMVLPVNGTREALFSFVQAVVSTSGTQSQARGRDAESVLPDLRRRGPAGRRGAGVPQHHAPAIASSPISTRCRPRSGSAARCCSCAARAIPPAACCRSTSCAMRSKLAEKYDFVIASDECYAELYRDEARAAAVAAAGGAAPTGTTRSSAAWCFIRCPSARAFPACAPASWPATRR